MAKYIHLYETTEAFEADYNGENYHEPWTSLTKQDGDVNYNKRCENVDVSAYTINAEIWDEQGGVMGYPDYELVEIYQTPLTIVSTTNEDFHQLYGRYEIVTPNPNCPDEIYAPGPLNETYWWATFARNSSGVWYQMGEANAISGGTGQRCSGNNGRGPLRISGSFTGTMEPWEYYEMNITEDTIATRLPLLPNADNTGFSSSGYRVGEPIDCNFVVNGTPLGVVDTPEVSPGDNGYLVKIAFYLDDNYGIVYRYGGGQTPVLEVTYSPGE